MLIFPSLLQKCKCIMFRMLALGMSYNIQCMYCFLFPKPENSWFMRHVWTQWFGMRDYGPVLEKCRMDAHIVLRITYHASEPETDILCHEIWKESQWSTKLTFVSLRKLSGGVEVATTVGTQAVWLQKSCF